MSCDWIYPRNDVPLWCVHFRLVLIFFCVFISGFGCVERLIKPLPLSEFPLSEVPLSQCRTIDHGSSVSTQVEPEVISSEDPLLALSEVKDRIKIIEQGPLLTLWRPLLKQLSVPVNPQNQAWISQDEMDDDDLFLEKLWLNADLLISLGATQASVLKPLLKMDLRSHQALMWLKAAPEWSPLSQYTLDPEAEIKAWHDAQWDPLKTGSVGVVLEEQRLLYLKGHGSGVRMVQEVVRVNNKRGVEELGEVLLPVNASLLSLYTLKPNGLKRMPLVIPEKEGYSLQDLQVGDMVIARYLEPLSALRRAGKVLTPRLPFHDTTRAVWRRVYHIWRLGDRPLSLYLHHAEHLREGAHQEFAYSISRTDVDGGRLLSVSIQRALPRMNEPSSLIMSEAPHFQVSERVEATREWGEVLSQLRDIVSLSLDDLSTIKDLMGSMHRMGVKVWSRIKDDRSLLESVPALEALKKGRGSRALALWSSLNALGKSCELWIARPPDTLAVSAWGDAHEIDPSLTISRYDQLLVACPQSSLVRSEFTLYDPSLYMSPKGVLNSSLFGGEALVLWPPPTKTNCSMLDEKQPRAWTMKSVSLDWPQEPQEQHHLTVSLWLDPNGKRGLLGAHVIHGYAEHSLTGEEGVLLYERLLKTSLKERVGWLERQWSSWIGASAVSELRFAWTEAHGLALSYQLEFSVRLPTQISISPQRWGERFASENTRRDTLILPPIQQVVRLSIRSQDPQEKNGLGQLVLEGENQLLQWPNSSENVHHLHPSWAQSKVTYQQQQEGLMFTSSWKQRGGLISPSHYPSWAHFARMVSLKERSLRLIYQP